MKQPVRLVCLSIAFLSGALLGVVWARGTKVPSAAYEGKAPKEAGQALLEAAEAQAGDGSWELIGVGRV